MISVKITVAMGSRNVPIDEVRDARIRSGLRAAADQVAIALEPVRCKVHDKQPSNIRIHFDKNGAADLKYDSCCEEFGKEVGKALG